MPYLAYGELDFYVIVGTYGDNFDRYALRLA
jgi:NADH-quinone oxidoreductase subunit D